MDCGLRSTTLAASRCEGQCTRPDVSGGPVWCWSPSEGLEIRQFPAHIGILKKWVLTPEKVRIGELARESEGKRTDSAGSFPSPLWALPPGVAQIDSEFSDLR